MKNNLLSIFFQSSTEVNAIDHFMQLMVKTNSFDQRLQVLQEQLQNTKDIQKKTSKENTQLRGKLVNREKEYLQKIENLNHRIREQSINLKQTNVDVPQLQEKLQQVESLKNKYSSQIDLLTAEKNILENQLRNRNYSDERKFELIISELKQKKHEADKQILLLIEKLSRLEKLARQNNNHQQLGNTSSKLTQRTSLNSFNELENGVWTDPKAGLMWARISVGQKWVDGKSQGEAKWVDWQKAENLCANMRLANFNDWRLPTIEELKTLMKKNEPGYLATNSVLIQPAVRSWGFYWSNKKVMHQVAEGINFDKGCLATYNYSNFDGYVRAVRNA